MSTITLRLPERLQTRLQSVALANHRSVNKQVAVLLEQALEAAQPAEPSFDATARYDSLMAIGRQYSALPVLDTRSDNDLLGYNEHGLPT